MDPGYAARYLEVERSHWWFRARRRILKGLLDVGIDWRTVRRVLEIGAGSGANLAELYPPEVELTGIEPDESAADLARERGIATIHTGVLEEAPRLLGDGHPFDVVALYDVLEHVEDDRAALRMLHRLVRPEGWLVLSVPAYQWLWSRHDEVNHHFRRYTRGGLVDRISRAGFEVQTATYFNSILFPALASIRLLDRLRPRRSGGADGAGLTIPGAGLNALLFRIFSAERPLLTRQALPFGLSIFILARREPAPAAVPSSPAVPVLS